jgi:DNA-binding Lrp family transcriptional regulator
MTGDTDLDDIDRRVVNALLEDGRASAREVGAAADIATATATNRIGKLEDEGVIEGYRAVVDYEALGYEVTAVFNVDVAGDGRDRVVDRLESNGRMCSVYEVTGSHDVVAIGKFEDTGALNAQLKDLLTDEDVRAATTNVVLDVVRENHRFRLPTDE